MTQAGQTSDARDILTLALTGTRHSGHATPQTTPQIDQLTTATDEVRDEGALLLRAGAWAAYRRAGYPPLPAPEPPAPAPADARPACSPAAGEAVATLLRGRRFDLLPEALARLRAAGLRLPPAVLPLALSSVGLTTELRAALIPALGERGSWLARFNPAWAWATEPSDDAMDDPARAQEAWDTGTLRQRVAALRGMRRRDPAAARDRLAVEWKREKAEARAALLAALSVNLSPDDEPLLNQALADRVDAVSGAATNLLYRLPTSRLARVTQQLLDATLTLTNGRLDARDLAAALSAGELDDGARELLAEWVGGTEMQVGEIIARLFYISLDHWSAEPQVGALLARLHYILPEHWEEHFAQPAESLIAATEGSQWRDELLGGWAVATVDSGSTHWAQALWTGWLLPMARDIAPSRASLATLLKALTPLLPPEDLLAPVALAINDATFYPQLSLAQLLDCLPRPWPDEVAGLFLEKLGKTLDEWDETASPAEPWISALSLAAVALPASSFAQARAVGAIADNQHRNLARWLYQLASFLTTLDLRERVIKEIPL